MKYWKKESLHAKAFYDFTIMARVSTAKPLRYTIVFYTPISNQYTIAGRVKVLWHCKW